MCRAALFPVIIQNFIRENIVKRKVFTMQRQPKLAFVAVARLLQSGKGFFRHVLLLYDEELAAVGILPAVCHCQRAAIEVEFFGYFVFEILSPAAFAACACAGGVACLYHEIFNDAVEDHTVIIAVLCQCFEVFDCLWGFFRIEPQCDITHRCCDDCDFLVFRRQLCL